MALQGLTTSFSLLPKSKNIFSRTKNEKTTKKPIQLLKSGGFVTTDK